jgi:hypothetical protein
MATRPRVDYHRHLASREWALLKIQVRERSGGLCERCGAKQQATHHLTYERLGHERLEDLLGVCNPCHEYLSGKGELDPAGARLDPLPQGIYLVVPVGNDPACAVRLWQEIVRLLTQAYAANQWRVFIAFLGLELECDMRVELSGKLGADLMALLGENNILVIGNDGRPI